MNKGEMDYYLARARQDYEPEPRIALDSTVVEARMMSYVTRMSRNGYIFDKRSLEALRAYSENYGLMLAGGVGVGKTMFFKALARDILILDMNDAMRWNYQTLEEWLMAARNREVLIDDLGVGSARGNDWGVSYDVMMIILNNRMLVDWRTHFTTNLSNDNLIRHFDYRVVDRIYGMAKVFELTRGVSRREPKPYPKN